jgi:hypothetical protein
VLKLIFNSYSHHFHRLYCLNFGSKKLDHGIYKITAT